MEENPTRLAHQTNRAHPPRHSLNFSPASKLERQSGRATLRASAAAFSLGRKGSYFAPKSGGEVHGQVVESSTSDDPNSSCRLCPAALVLLRRRRIFDPLIGKWHWRPAIATPLPVQATQARK